MEGGKETCGNVLKMVWGKVKYEMLESLILVRFEGSFSEVLISFGMLLDFFVVNNNFNL
jgi:hypothetical protein